MKKIILDLCGGTGSWSLPYKKAGYEVINITLPDFDVTTFLYSSDYLYFSNNPLLNIKLRLKVKIANIYGILAAPPCTMFSFAQTTAKTPRDFAGAMAIVKVCLEIIWKVRINGKLKFWALENPQDYLRQFLGRPAFNFQPYDFGEHYSKQTDIWGYFNLPKKHPIKLTERELLQSKNNTRPLPKLPTGYKPIVENQTQARRAMTPQGFALAFYKANK